MRARTFVLLVATLGCFNASEPLATDTGVTVEVGLWPVDPVEVEGQPSRTRPAAGAHVVARSADGEEAGDAVTDEDGVARIVLAPGTYTIAVTECPGAMSLPKENATVDVRAGAFATAALACDTGIR